MENKTYPYIIEMVQALNDEIKELEKKGQSEIKVSGGKLSRIDNGEYVYTFVIGEEIITTDDQPIELQVGQTRYKGTLVSKISNTLTVAVRDNLGEKIDYATIIVSPVFLLKSLIATLDQIPKIKNYNFDFTDSIIGKKLLPAVKLERDFIDSGDKKLNTEQLEALQKALASSVLFIWGPPGTGKTTVIAKIVENLLKNNKRILVTSHTNIAVDTVLADVLENEGNSVYYEAGQLLRYGNHQLHKLDKKPLIFGTNIVTHQSKNLLEKLQYLDKAEESLKNEVSSLEKELLNIRHYRSLIEQKNKNLLRLGDIENEMNNLNIKLESHKSLMALITTQINKARENNWFLNKIQGLNVENLMSKLKEVEKEIQDTKSTLVTLSNEKDKLQESFEFINKTIVRFGKNIAQIDEAGGTVLLQEKLDKIDSLRVERRSIQDTLDNMTKSVLNTAKLVATTLTKCYLRPELISQSFDTVIIDEISMAQIPHLLVAIGMGKQVILVGDFLQLPPIVMAKTEVALKWLGSNLYDYFEIPRAYEGGALIPQVVALKEQFRMHSDISLIVNRLVYKGNLRDNIVSVKKRSINSSLGPFNGHVAFFDTLELEAGCKNKEGGSRYNIKNAFIDLYIAFETVNSYLNSRSISEEEVEIFGIVTPYRAQANLITKLISEITINNEYLAKFVEVNTVHRFQGNQRNVILFDTTDDKPMWGPAPIVDDNKEGGLDVRLVNVAVTRSKDKYILLGNSDFINYKHSKSSLIKQMLPTIYEKGKCINNLKEINKFTGNNTIKYISNDTELVSFISESTSNLKIVIADIVTDKVFNLIKENLENLVKNGIEIELHTQDISYYDEKYKVLVNSTHDLLRQAGIKILLRNKIGEHILIRDDSHLFINTNSYLEGISLNSAKGSSEIIKLLGLDENPGGGDCPDCLKAGRNGKVILKQSRYGKFYACTLYPVCKYKKTNLNEKEEGPDISEKCPNCGKDLVKKRGKFGIFWSCTGYPECKFTRK